MTERAMYQEGAQVLAFLRMLGTEEQRIAYAVLEGMRLQKNLDSQSRVRKPEDPRPSA